MDLRLNSTSAKPDPPSISPPDGPPSIRALNLRVDVSTLLLQLYGHPELWNRHTLRTTQYRSPHDRISDIWVRYNAWKNYDPETGLGAFNGPHKSVWYPGARKIPAVFQIVDTVYKHVGATGLGGVLITKISPGGQVLPHVDQGWHAETYTKFAVQVLGNADQTFHFENSSLSPYPGDTYTFDNSKLHWVTNNSSIDRITLIICLKVPK